MNEKLWSEDRAFEQLVNISNDDIAPDIYAIKASPDGGLLPASTYPNSKGVLLALCSLFRRGEDLRENRVSIFIWKWIHQHINVVDELNFYIELAHQDIVTEPPFTSGDRVFSDFPCSTSQ